MAFKCNRCQNPLKVEAIHGPLAAEIDGKGFQPVAIMLGCPECGVIINNRLYMLNIRGGETIADIWDDMKPADRKKMVEVANITCKQKTFKKRWSDFSRQTQEKLKPIFMVE